MNSKYYADKILALLNEELEINELRERLIAIIGEIRAEATQHPTKGTEQYKRIDEDYPIREITQRSGTLERGIPIKLIDSNEERFTPEDRIGEE